MVRTRFALMLYFMACWPVRLHVIPVEGSIEINEVMIQILLMLEVLFTQDSVVGDLFCGAPSDCKSGLFLSNYLFGLGRKPIQHDFQHDLT